MLIHPSPLRNGQAVRGARQAGRFVLTRRLKGLEHGGQALIAQRGQTEAGFPGRHLSWEQSQVGEGRRHTYSLPNGAG
jgi:hypothetical protein